MPANPLVLGEREEIRAGIERGDTITQIAVDLDRSRSAVSEEVNRNGGRDHYKAVDAQKRADTQRRRPKPFRLAQDKQLARHVQNRLAVKDSPETITTELANGCYPQITGRVRHETIYKAVQGRGRRVLPAGLSKHLHRRRPRRKPNQRSCEPVPAPSPLGLFNPVINRPPDADDRSLEGGVIGHFEGDLILGSFNRSAVVTVFERVTNYCLLADLPEGHGSDDVLAALVELIDRIPDHLPQSLTWDQGREIAAPLPGSRWPPSAGPYRDGGLHLRPALALATSGQRER